MSAEPLNGDRSMDVRVRRLLRLHRLPRRLPLVMSDLMAGLLQSPARVRNSTQLLFITTDPTRDSPALLRRYLDHYNPGFVGLTGRLLTRPGER